MPPKKPKPPRCAYVEQGQRCKRPGTGNPALCEAHRIVIEATAAHAARPGERFVGILGRFLRGQKVNDDQLFGGIEDLVGVFQQNPSVAQAAARVRDQVRERVAPRAHRPPPPPRRPPGPDPRIALGFAAGQKVTVEEVKKRHRELARKHHPDRGGDVRKMAAINHAVDQLLATLVG